MENHLKVPINKRFVTAMQHIHKQYGKAFAGLCEEIGYSAASFDKVKRGERSLPEEYHSPAARLLDRYGISTVWFLHGTGTMLKDNQYLSDDNAMLTMLQNELRLKEQLLRKLAEENKQLKAKLRTYEG